MPTALGRRLGAVYGEKSPKTRLARIYCYGNTLYTVEPRFTDTRLRGEKLNYKMVAMNDF